MAQRGQQTRYLTAEITATESLPADRRKTVTQYIIRISATTRRETWIVYRRYSKFHDLHTQLEKRFRNHVLPPIPPKRYLGKEDPQFIEQRRLELQEYLNELLAKPVEISLSEEICLFLEVPEPLRLCFLETDARVPQPTALPMTGPQDRRAVGHGGSAEDCRVTWLLSQFEELPNNKVSSIRNFEAWFLKSQPQLKEESVLLLYLGPDEGGGLLAEVGAFEHSEVSSITALNLLCKLLSPEHCGEATLFEKCLRSLDLGVLARMRLQHHIHTNRGHSNRLDSFRVLRSLSLTSDGLQALLQDDFALQEFRRWQQALEGSLQGALRSSETRHRSSTTTSGTGAALSLSEYRKVAENAFTSVRMFLSTFVLPEEAAPAEDDIEPPTPAEPSTPLEGKNLSRVDISSLGMIADKLAEAAGSISPSPGPSWHTVPCPHAAWISRFALRAAYQKLPHERQSDASDVPERSPRGYQDAYLARAVARLPFPAHLVACVLADHTRFIANALHYKRHILPPDLKERLMEIAETHFVHRLQSATVLETVESVSPDEASAEVIEVTLGSPISPHSSVKMCLLKTVRLLPGAGPPTLGGSDPPSSYLFVYSSVPHVVPQEAVSEGHPRPSDLGIGRSGLPRAGAYAPRRVDIKPSGVLLQPVSEDTVELSLCAILGQDSISLVSGDLLGESLLLWETLDNLIFVCQHLCPLPPDFSHPLLQWEREGDSNRRRSATSPRSSSSE